MLKRQFRVQRRALGVPASSFGFETCLVTVGKTLVTYESIYLPGFPHGTIYFFLFVTFLECSICIIYVVAVMRSVCLPCPLRLSYTNLSTWWQHKLCVCFISEEMLSSLEYQPVTISSFCLLLSKFCISGLILIPHV